MNEPSKAKTKGRQNNFDLLRFLAALQVVLWHGREHLKIENEAINLIIDKFLSFFPGVPIFFFISGFLIYGSYQSNRNNVLQYWINRVLRIFPALWVCLLVTVLLLFVDFDGNLLLQNPKQFLVWIVGQLSFFQFYTPDFLRFWGIGTPNGSLWTITVELQFYLLIPMLFLLFSRFKRAWISILCVILVSIATNYILAEYKVDNDNMITKLAGVFVLPYLYYFLIGVAFKIYWKRISVYFESKFLQWIIGYALFVIIFNYILNFDLSSYWIKTPLNIIATLILAGVTFSFSYSFVGLGTKILRGNDISYGLYIYHMVVVNFLVQRGLVGEEVYLLVTIIATLLLASASWFFVEKKILTQKYSLSTYVRARLGKQI